MSTRTNNKRKRLKTALGKIAEAARELVEAEQAYHGHNSKKRTNQETETNKRKESHNTILVGERR